LPLGQFSLLIFTSSFAAAFGASVAEAGAGAGAEAGVEAGAGALFPPSQPPIAIAHAATARHSEAARMEEGLRNSDAGSLVMALFP
jgi:hypothetical protein